MVVELIEGRNKPCKTKIRISLKEWTSSQGLRKVFSGIEPEKESTRYKYFVVDGDLLNNRH